MVNRDEAKPGRSPTPANARRANGQIDSDTPPQEYPRRAATDRRCASVGVARPKNDRAAGPIKIRMASGKNDPSSILKTSSRTHSSSHKTPEHREADGDLDPEPGGRGKPSCHRLRGGGPCPRAGAAFSRPAAFGGSAAAAPRFPSSPSAGGSSRPLLRRSRRGGSGRRLDRASAVFLRATRSTGPLSTWHPRVDRRNANRCAQNSVDASRSGGKSAGISVCSATPYPSLRRHQRCSAVTARHNPATSAAACRRIRACNWNAARRPRARSRQLGGIDRA